MILEFLKAEYRSERFSDSLQNAMRELFSDEGIILSADLNSAEENAARRKLLGKFRGYGENRELFENFPDVTEWLVCVFGGDDLSGIRYIDYSYWNELSAGTRSPIKAAETIRRGTRIYGQSNDDFLKAAEFIKSGGKFLRPVLLTADMKRFVIVEGHLRMTAYALAREFFSGVECIVGKCEADALEKWS